jgi:prepilin-type processing-associated H-X9-DG protein
MKNDVAPATNFRGRDISPRCPDGSASRPYLAFTRTELLVLLVVIGFLAALLLPAFAAATREKAPRVQCQNNLQQLWLAVQIYGNENNDKPPQGDLGVHNTNPSMLTNNLHAGGSLWDLPDGSTYKLIDSGAKRAIFFCAGQRSSIMDTDYWWNYGTSLDASGRTIPAGQLGQYTTQGYLWMFDRGDVSCNNTRPVYSDNGGTPNLNRRRQLTKKLSVANTNLTLSTTELIADITVSEGNNRSTAKFINVSSANSGTVLGGLVFSGYNTSHVQGKQLSGGNILFLDGHADWRPASQMDWIVGWSNNRYFWF